MPTNSIQTHVSINTIDLARSVRFYQALLAASPSLTRSDYARFDLDQPALVLGLNAVRHTAVGLTGPLEHLGVRFSSEAELSAALERLRAIGCNLKDEHETECCYARLRRTWASDPSGVRWELFIALEPVVESKQHAGQEASCCEPTCCATQPS